LKTVIGYAKMTNTLLFTPTIFGVSIEVYLILLVLVLPTFYFWRWLLKKLIKTDKTRKIATWIATIVATPIIYVGLALLLFFYMTYFPESDFNKEKWFADKEKRYELSDDLIESKILIGKTKEEVRQLLGDELNTDNSNHWNYYLGFRPSLLGIDPDVLDIQFKDGKVVYVGQHET
jgi:hypothetical protein